MRDLGGHVPDTVGVGTGLGVSELGEDRELLERFEVMGWCRCLGRFGERAVIAGIDVLVPQPEDLGLVAGGRRFVGDLQGPQPEIGGVREHLPVLVVVCLSALQRLFEPAADVYKRQGPPTTTRSSASGPSASAD